jgi:hypothetical protein
LIKADNNTFTIGCFNNNQNKRSVRNFDVPASTPVGRRGSPMDVPRGTNTETVIGGRTYTRHALDQMQGSGFVPSVVEDTIQKGVRTPSRDGIGAYSTSQARSYN